MAVALRIEAPLTWRAWFTTILLMLTATLAFIDRTILNLLVEPIKAELGFSDTQMGVLQGVAFSLFYGTLSVPIGRLADATNRKYVILGSVLAWSSATVMTGFSRVFSTMFLCRAGVAAGEAGVSPSAGAIIADLFPRDRLALPMSVYTMSIYIGGGLALFVGGSMLGYFKDAGAVTVPLFGSMAPWRATFVAVGLLGVPWFAFLALLLREPARREYGHFESSTAACQALSVRKAMGFLMEHRHFFGNHFVGFAFGLAMISATLAWIPTILIRIFAMPIEEAGRTFGVLYIVCGIGGALAGGWLSNRISMSGRKEAPLELAALACLGVLVAVSGLTLVKEQSAAVALCGAAVFFIAPGIALPVAAFLSVTPNRLRAQMSGLFLMVTGILGIGSGPVITALVTDYVFADAGSLHYSLAIASALLCAMMLPVLFRARLAMRTLDL